MDKKNKLRKIDISSKLMSLGNALVREGSEIDDYAIMQSGNVLMLLSAIILDDEDMYSFCNLCSMYSAKKELDLLRNNLNENPISYEELIKKLKNLGGENDQKPSA
jgi:hypothetical protein